MVVSVPLHYSYLAAGAASSSAGAGVGAAIHEALCTHYASTSGAGKGDFVTVAPLGEAAVKEEGLLERGAFLRPDSLANTNDMEVGTCT